MARIPIGLELYSVRRELEQDPRGTLQAVADMGYTAVEFAGPLKRPAAELRAMLEACGLACCGWHTPWELVQESRLAETIAINQTLGNRYVIIPGIPAEQRRTRADWLRLARFFNDLSRRLADHGLVTGYHNHHVEFTPLEGETPWQTFFDHTDPSVVMQLDFGNALCGGADVVAILKRYPGRAATVHVKPYSRQAGRENPGLGYRPLIGDDEVPWAEVFRLCESSGGTQWYIVEYESDLFTPLEAVRRCLERLRAMGK